MALPADIDMAPRGLGHQDRADSDDGHGPRHANRLPHGREQAGQADDWHPVDEWDRRERDPYAQDSGAYEQDPEDAEDAEQADEADLTGASPEADQAVIDDNEAWDASPAGRFIEGLTSADEMDDMPDVAAEEALELRVLSGLQAGAALPLGDGLTVGSGDNCDVLLLDDGIAPAHLQVNWSAHEGLSLHALDGPVADARCAELSEASLLSIGAPFSASGVWLVVQPRHEPWAAWQAPQRATEPPLSEPAKSESAEPTAAPPELEITTEPRAAMPVRPRSSSALVRLVVLGAGALSTLLGTVALLTQMGVPVAGDATAQPVASARQHEPSTRANVRPDTEMQSAPPGPTGAPSPAGPAHAAGTSPSITASAASLWPASAHPTRERRSVGPMAEGRQERSVADARHPGQAVTVVRLSDQESVVLPFVVREVVLGQQSLVRLTDGRTLAPGDEVAGWHLREVRLHTLVFDGEQRVQVPW